MGVPVNAANSLSLSYSLSLSSLGTATLARADIVLLRSVSYHCLTRPKVALKPRLWTVGTTGAGFCSLLHALLKWLRLGLDVTEVFSIDVREK